MNYKICKRSGTLKQAIKKKIRTNQRSRQKSRERKLMGEMREIELPPREQGVNNRQQSDECEGSWR